MHSVIGEDCHNFTEMVDKARRVARQQGFARAGDYIVVINSSKLRVTGSKGLNKIYYRHSGYPGGISSTNFDKMQARFPARALEKAVKGMLPKGPLGYAMIKKLKVYGDATHPHTAQQPKPLEI